jgi:hypothetical protein
MRFRLLVPHYLNGRYFEAGDTVDAANGDIPANWQPNIAAVDPLDTAAIQAFWNVGPGATGAMDAELFRMVLPYYRYSTHYCANPSVHWTPTGTPGMFILTGAGASLGPRRQ